MTIRPANRQLLRAAARRRSVRIGALRVFCCTCVKDFLGQVAETKCYSLQVAPSARSSAASSIPESEAVVKSPSARMLGAIVAVVISASTAAAQERVLVLQGGTLIDGTGRPPIADPV